MFPVRILDGIGASLQNVAVPALVSRLLQGIGRVNVGQGAVMTVQGMTVALSPALGGGIAQSFAYRAASLWIGPAPCGSCQIDECGDHCCMTRSAMPSSRCLSVLQSGRCASSRR